MSLAPGTRLGPYEFISPLGAGVLFAAPAGATRFDATADHQRFLVVEPVADAEPAAIELNLNWAAAPEKR